MKDIEKIRPVDGFSEMTGKLIKVMCDNPPDFETADELIGLGADLNEEGADIESNALCEVIEMRGFDLCDLIECKQSEKCMEISCVACNQYEILKQAYDIGNGGTIEVIKYFLRNGFDVNAKDGLYGAQCLFELTLPMASRHLLEATKILFDAGAQDTYVDPPYNDCTPRGFIATEGSYQRTCHADHHLSNIYEAAWEMYYNREQGRPYGGIHTYEDAIGKTIIGVLADSPGSEEPFYTQGGPGPMLGNCFNCNLYFILDDGVLVASEYTEFWVDKNAPYAECVDVSKRFRRILGTQIEEITFEYDDVTKSSADYGRPIADLKMSNSKILRFYYNFHEVNGKKETAYYNIVNQQK